MNRIWKIGKVLYIAFGKFQEAASDGVISLEDAFGILKSALDELGIKLNYNITQQEAIATLRRLNVIR